MRDYKEKNLSKQYRPRLNDGEKMAYYKSTRVENRVLVIGDIHEPFSLEGYLEFCIKTYYDYNCNKVVFIGDIIDSHFSSFHENDINALGGNDELNLAITKISRWYKAFPEAIVTLGNHDRLIMRKSQTSSIPLAWIKSFKEVLKTPKWEFTDRVVIDNVQYIHGEGGNAVKKCKDDMMSTVQGHLHSFCYINWFVGQHFKIFGMQVGCGVDHDSYAMAYAKRGKKPAIACGVVIDGKEAINVVMDL